VAHAGSQIQGRVVAQQARLSATSTETGIHPEKQWQEASAWDSETNEQQFNHLLTDMVWDETTLNRQRIVQMQTLPSAGDGVLILDDTGFEKQGRHSVGVAHQYTGTAGKVTNCQVTVNCHYAERTWAWPVATRLYLPQA
jgi:SRSO17 transposase